MATELIQATPVLLKDVEAAPWNVNVMTPEKFEQLKLDMKADGPENTDPIDTCMLDGKKYTCDGAHRLKAAKELGWDHLYEILHPEIKTEADARLFNYKRDANRGDVDELKLAASFKWFQDQGWTQTKIGEKFGGIDRSTVSKKISLLGVDPEVRKQVLSNTKFGTASHLEPLATLTPAQQKRAVEELNHDSRIRDVRPANGERVSVRVVEEKVQQIKRQDAVKKSFDELLAKAKVKRCPTCGKPPVLPGLHDYSTDKFPLFECSSINSWEHKWDPFTGKQPNKPREYTPTSSKPRRPEVQQFVRSTRGFDEFTAAFAQYVKQLIPQFEQVLDIKVEGLIGGEVVRLDIDKFHGSDSVNFSLSKRNPEADPWRSKSVMSFHVEGKEYNVPALKDFRTVITQGTRLRSSADLKALEKVALGFLEKYSPKKGAVARATLGRKKTG